MRPESDFHGRRCGESRSLLFLFSRMSLIEIAQLNFTRKDSTADCTIRTLTRIDRAFINLPMAEARDFHGCSHVFENLGEEVHTE